MFRRSLFLLLCLALNSVWAEVVTPKRINVAVMPFTGDRSTDADHLDFITATFTVELIKLNYFNVLDRGKINFILEEQGFQQSGACSSTDCKVQIGQLLGMDYVISGKLVRLGQARALNVEFTDLQSGRIVKTIFEQKKGRLEDIFEEMCSLTAAKLVQEVQYELEALPSIEHPSQVKLSGCATAKPEVPQVKEKSYFWAKLFAGVVGVGALAGGIHYERKTRQNIDEFNFYLANKNRAMSDEFHKAAKENSDIRTGFYVVSGIAFLSFPFIGLEAKE